MPRPPKMASTIDNNKHHTSRKKLDVRQKTEQELASKTRELKCPSFLSKGAKDEWTRIIAIDNSRHTPVIFDSDAAALEILCELRSAWMRCQKNWLFVSEKERPEDIDELTQLMDVETKLNAEMRKLGKELELQYSKFALTPLGRAKIGSCKAKDSQDGDNDWID